jgi:hypothetical protein
MCTTADEVLQLVRTRMPLTDGPTVRDWNDRLLVAAFTRAYRCLRSTRRVAGTGEADDAAVLTRALVALTLRYLWLTRVDDDDERRVRLRLLVRKWARERATLGEELIDLGYLPDDTADARHAREAIAAFRAQANEFVREELGRMPDDCTIAKSLDRELEPTSPRLFELIYARIYRTTSDVAHYGLGTALTGIARRPADPGALTLEQPDERRAADALGLALVTYGAFLEFSEPVVHHGLAEGVAALMRPVMLP